MALIPQFDLNYALTWTTICNYALQRLGISAIVDLSEGTPNAEICSRFLPAAIQHLLNQYDFNFAKRRMRLAPLVEKPLFGWKEQYIVPPDLLRIIWVYGTDKRMPEVGDLVPYQFEGRRILANTPQIEVLYIARPLSPEELPYHFADCLAAYLASLVAPALTSSEQLIALSMQQAQEQIEKAKRIDAQQNYAPEFNGEHWYR